MFHPELMRTCPNVARLGEFFCKNSKGSSTKATEILRTWDTDGDGSISRKEFTRSLRALGLEASDEEIADLVSIADRVASA